MASGWILAFEAVVAASPYHFSALAEHFRCMPGWSLFAHGTIAYASVLLFPPPLCE